MIYILGKFAMLYLKGFSFSSSVHNWDNQQTTLFEVEESDSMKSRGIVKECKAKGEKLD